MTNEEALKLAMGLRTDFKCESDTMVDFCNTIIKALKQEPCDDCISREAALSIISCHFLLEDDKDKTDYEFAYEDGIKTAYEDVERLPPVQLKQKTGHWTNGDGICPCCREDKFKDLDADIWADWKPKYCPNCGAKMIESEEL